MTETVKYSRFEPYSDLGAGGLQRPYIAVRLQRGGVFFDTYGLIDSGADGSLFHLDYALALGLTPDPAHKEQMHGVGGDTDIWKFDIYLSVGGTRFPARVAFSASWQKEFGLLGRADSFNAFRVGFEHRNSRVLYHALS